MDEYAIIGKILGWNRKVAPARDGTDGKQTQRFEAEN